MKPYYQDERNGITIYHGDAREVLPALGKVDLLCADPPYGIGNKWNGGSGHGWGKAAQQSDARNRWDADRPSRETIEVVVDSADRSIIWGGNYFSDCLPASRCWLIWSKPERGFTLAEAEVAWTNADNVIRVWDGPRSDPGRIHPTQKPIGLMRWCLSLSWTKTARTILDPFMGSGTTLVAAKQLGRKAIGIELEEKYCEIAAKRLSQETLQLPEPVAAAKTEQGALDFGGEK